MRIVWDEPKRLRNLREHRLDFADLEKEFDFTASMIVTAYASRFGTGRLKAVGVFRGTIVTVVFSDLGSEAVSIISFRPSSGKERRAYAQSHSPC